MGMMLVRRRHSEKPIEPKTEKVEEEKVEQKESERPKRGRRSKE